MSIDTPPTSSYLCSRFINDDGDDDDAGGGGGDDDDDDYIGGVGYDVDDAEVNY